MAREAIVPVVVLEDAAKAVQLAAALEAGGCGLIEITLRTPAALTAISEIGRQSAAIVGAGTVLNADQVRSAHAAGARFIVSPGFDLAVVETALSLGLLSIPGVCTASEIQSAWNHGIHLVKFFPAGACGGVATLRQLAGTFQDMRFMPTGGINETNLAEYLGIAAVTACGGTWLAPTDLIAAGNFAEITRRTTAACRIARALRQ